MSKVYTTAATDKGITTRAGHHWARVAAQTWDGSVVVELDGAGNVSIGVADGSSATAERRLWAGTLAELKVGKALVLR